jgi:hypothetical protein
MPVRQEAKNKNGQEKYIEIEIDFGQAFARFPAPLNRN